MKQKILITLGIIGLIMTTSCNTIKKKENKGTIEDKKWVLTEFINTHLKDSPDEYYIIFHSENSKLETKVGCNNMTATYKINDSSEIKVDMIVSTRMACPNGQINEHEYAKQIQAISKYSLSQDNNTLYLKDNQEATVAVYKLVE